MMRKLLLIVVILIPSALMAQLDVPTSQYFSNQAIFNPAYSGIHGVTSMTFNSRLQWAGVEGAPFTNIFNIHSSFLDDKLGGGLMVMNDKYGVNSNNEIQLSYSYKIDLQDIVLSLGLQTGLVSFSYDYGKLNTEMSDPNFLESGETFVKPNFGAGVFIMSDKYYLGVSIPKFLNLVVENGGISSSRYRRHFYLSGGILLDQLFAVKVKPSFLLRSVDGGFNAFDLNLNVLLSDRVWVGASLRNFGDAFSVNSLLEINKNLRAGMSIEVSSQTFSRANYGSYEIMISYDFGSVGNRYF